MQDENTKLSLAYKNKEKEVDAFKENFKSFEKLKKEEYDILVKNERNSINSVTKLNEDKKIKIKFFYFLKINY